MFLCDGVIFSVYRNGCIVCAVPHRNYTFDIRRNDKLPFLSDTRLLVQNNFGSFRNIIRPYSVCCSIVRKNAVQLGINFIPENMLNRFILIDNCFIVVLRIYALDFGPCIVRILDFNVALHIHKGKYGVRELMLCTRFCIPLLIRRALFEGIYRGIIIAFEFFFKGFQSKLIVFEKLLTVLFHGKLVF